MIRRLSRECFEIIECPNPCRLYAQRGYGIEFTIDIITNPDIKRIQIMTGTSCSLSSLNIVQSDLRDTCLGIINQIIVERDLIVGLEFIDFRRRYSLEEPIVHGYVFKDGAYQYIGIG